MCSLCSFHVCFVLGLRSLGFWFGFGFFGIQGFAICGGTQFRIKSLINWNMRIQLKMKESFISLETINVSSMYGMALCAVRVARFFGTILIVSSLFLFFFFFRYFIRWLWLGGYSRWYFTNGWNIYCRCIKGTQTKHTVSQKNRTTQFILEREKKSKHKCTVSGETIGAKCHNNLINARTNNK